MMSSAFNCFSYWNDRCLFIYFVFFFHFGKVTSQLWSILPFGLLNHYWYSYADLELNDQPTNQPNESKQCKMKRNLNEHNSTLNVKRSCANDCIIYSKWNNFMIFGFESYFTCKKVTQTHIHTQYRFVEWQTKRSFNVLYAVWCMGNFLDEEKKTILEQFTFKYMSQNEVFA